MVKKCNGQDIFLSSGGSESTATMRGLGGGGSGRAAPRWGDRSRSPPPRYSKGYGKAAAWDDWGPPPSKGYGKGFGKSDPWGRGDPWGPPSRVHDDDFLSGYLAGLRKGRGKGKSSERYESRERNVYASFGGKGDRKGGKGKDTSKGDGRKGGRSEKGSGKGRKGKGRDGPEKSSGDLDKELAAYFGGKPLPEKGGKDGKGKEQPSEGQLDDELDAYMKGGKEDKPEEKAEEKKEEAKEGDKAEEEKKA